MYCQEDDHLLLSLDQPLDQLRQYRHQLIKLKERNPASVAAVAPEANPTALPLASGFQVGIIQYSTVEGVDEDQNKPRL